jgi:hypothetical protein
MAGDTQGARSVGEVAVRLLERSLDLGAFALRGRRLDGGSRARSRLTLAERARQVRELDALETEREQPLHLMFELAHVAWPRVTFERTHGVGAERDARVLTLQKRAH